MKRNLLLSALLLVLPLAAHAETVDLGMHGSLSITVPKGWKLITAPSEQPGINISLTPPEGINAQFSLGILYVQKGQTGLKADVDAKVLNEAALLMDGAVEKTKILRKLPLAGDAYGSYCVFTDASLVGKPPQKDNFKVASAGIIWFNDDVSGGLSMLTDDEKGADFAAMVGAASSVILKSK
jgi:hypothetical protein